MSLSCVEKSQLPGDHPRRAVDTDPDHLHLENNAAASCRWYANADLLRRPFLYLGLAVHETLRPW